MFDVNYENEKIDTVIEKTIVVTPAAEITELSIVAKIHVGTILAEEMTKNEIIGAIPVDPSTILVKMHGGVVAAVQSYEMIIADPAIHLYIEAVIAIAVAETIKDRRPE
jgi:hypothetical protein